MLSSLSSGVSGLESFQQEMDVIGNNISNINTVGFKAATTDFADSLSNTLQGAGQNTDAMQVGTGVYTAAINNNWNNGAIEPTGVASQLAINGNGFFEVVDPNNSSNVFVTRDGEFTVNSAGDLVTAGGYLVQGYAADGSTIGAVTVTTDPSKAGTVSMTSYSISDTGQIQVSQSDGTTYTSGTVLLMSIANPNQLVSQGANLYSNMEAANGGTLPTLATPGSAGSNLGQIDGGSLESSNVDLSNEMANLITAQRAFEANSKMITTSNEVLQTVVNMKQS
jgi:flagellar hook protein FlgE